MITACFFLIVKAMLQVVQTEIYMRGISAHLPRASDWGGGRGRGRGKEGLG